MLRMLLILLYAFAAIPLSAQVKNANNAKEATKEKSSAKKSSFPTFQGYQWGNARFPDVESALDPAKSETFRLRMIDEVGRYGDTTMTSRLQEALGDESPAIRIATMRSLMRLGIDDARPQLYKTLRDATNSAKERSWAARALARSKSPKETVPELINALGVKDGELPADGEQAAIIESLRRLTGVSLGARPKTLFSSLIGKDAAPSTEAYRAKWLDWWKENGGKDPSAWRFDALASEIPKDRASAARLLGEKGDFSSVPKLLAAFKQEAEENGTSAVREAIAESLEDLTGIKVKYSPFVEKGQTPEEWLEGHEEALKRWTTFHEAVTKKGKNPILLKLASDSAKTRADTLRSIRYESREELAISEMAKMLSDPSGQVAKEAWKTLVRCTGIAFPFNPDDATDLKKIQIATWEDWAREHERAEEAVRLLSIFEDVSKFHWGGNARALYPEAAKIAAEELESALVSMRSRALSHIARRSVKVDASSLIRHFEQEILKTEAALLNRQPRALASLLQKNYIHALTKTGDFRVPALIIKRLKIAREAREKMARPGSIDDSDVVRTCVFCLGEIGDLLNAESLLRELTIGANEPRYRIRGQAARALGRCGDKGVRFDLTNILERTEEHVYVRLGAIDGLMAVAQRYPSEHAGVLSIFKTLYSVLKDDEARWPTELRHAAKRAYDFLNVAPVD